MFNQTVTHQERVGSWSRRFVFAGVCWLVLWQIALLSGADPRTGIVFGLFGFVFHTIFGKGYSLLPSYFDRTLVTTRLLPGHFGCAVLGTGALGVGFWHSIPLVTVVGVSLYGLGVVLFVGTLAWTARDNLTGTETGTSEASKDRRPLDRLANLFVPVVLIYLCLGTYGLLAVETALPTLFDGYPPRSTHLLAAGAGGLLVFAVGFRLLPRFFVAHLSRFLPAIVLSAGAVGPLFIASSIPDGRLLPLGAALQTVAVGGYAIVVWMLFRQRPRTRVGFYGIGAGAVAGVAGVLLGVWFVLDGVSGATVAPHRRLQLLGFLGLTIIGVSYQFYPPGVSSHRLVDDRTALFALALLIVALLVETGGHLLNSSSLVIGGHLVATAGAVVHAVVISSVFRAR